jgi:hypothetical protein
MREDDRTATALQQQPDSRQRGTDASIVGDFAVIVERHVEVDAKEHPLASHLRVAQIAYGFLFHFPLA